MIDDDEPPLDLAECVCGAVYPPARGCECGRECGHTEDTTASDSTRLQFRANNC
jgi:hypothetical protein